MKTRNDPRDESALSKFSNRTRRIIEAIARSPLADQAVENEERASMAQRAALGAELAKLDATVTDERLVAAVAAGRTGVEKAEQAVKVAQQKLRDADVALMNAESIVSKRRAEVLQELHETADERLWQYIAKLRGIIGHDISLAMQVFVETKKNSLGYVERSYRTNADDLTIALKACERVMAAADACRLEPLDYVEVSQRLMTWCQELAGPLGSIQINPPSLTAEHAEVGPNVPWSGSTWWIREEPFRQTRREQLERVSADIKAKTPRQMA